jgi:simple sugar transport system ATP-binding protein
MKKGQENVLLELENVSKYFGSIIALNKVNITLRKNAVNTEKSKTKQKSEKQSLRLKRGEVHCLLGDNGAGKSTLIKTLAGVHLPTYGKYYYEGEEVSFQSPRDALNAGIATVYQDLALVPLMSVARNFFMGSEPIKKVFGFFPKYDEEKANRVTKEKLAEIGIHIRDANQNVGTMSGGERQCLAISRAVFFGAKVLILDEPTAALGVKQSANVLKLIQEVKSRGISIIFITHNINHAYPVADRFTLLNRGGSMGTFEKKDVTKDKILTMMSGEEELSRLISKTSKEI